MKTAKIHVNKTPEKPDGVEIDIVQPDNAFEGRVISYLLVHAVRQAKHDNRIPYKLPTAFTVDHRGEGTFIIMGTPPPPETAAPVRGGGYYSPPRPLAIVGLRMVGQHFELIHAELNQEALKKVAEARREAARPSAPAEKPAAPEEPKPTPEQQTAEVQAAGANPDWKSST
jgi:hypothetical protein